MEHLASQNKQPEKKVGKGLKITAIILSVVTVLLIAVLLYMRSETIKIVADLNVEKDELVVNLENLRGEYNTLQTSNDTLNEQLELEKHKVELMIEKIRHTDATNRARIREYEKELGTLRDIMRSYIRQLDSLNTLNIQLREETSTAKAEAQQTREKYETLIQTTDDLAQKVEQGGMLKARDVVITGINTKGKDVTRARSTDKLKTCFTLLENSIAKRGTRTIFIRVKGPDGILMTQSQNRLFVVGDEHLVYSDMREIDYQGSDIGMCIFYGGNNEQFAKGAYTVDIYADGALIGSGQALLK
jgi:predicted nuclease with TOPRIM domain